MTDVFRRDLSPVIVGVVVGILLAFSLDKLFQENSVSITARSVSETFIFIIVIGLLAVAGPARRLLRIDSTEALRES